MPVRLAFRWTGTEELRRILAPLKRPGLDKPVGRALVACGYLVLANAAEKQIIRGGRFRGPGGVLRDSPPDPHRLTSRSGELRRSLGVDRGLSRAGLGDYYVEVGSDLVYAPIHELGLGRYPERPFLGPALEAVSDQFEDVFAKEIASELDSA